MREGFAEVQVDAGLWTGRPRRWWRDPVPMGWQHGGLTGQALVDWAYALATKYPANVRFD